MKKRGETRIPDDFALTPATLAWLARKYPQIDVEETLEKFRRRAEAEGWMYANWQRGFEGIVVRGMETGWRSIVTIRGGIQHDPKWQSILQEARPYGFREPFKTDTPQVYRTAFENWRRELPISNVIPLAGVLRKVV